MAVINAISANEHIMGQFEKGKGTQMGGILKEWLATQPGTSLSTVVEGDRQRFYAHLPSDSLPPASGLASPHWIARFSPCPQEPGKYEILTTLFDPEVEGSPSSQPVREVPLEQFEEWIQKYPLKDRFAYVLNVLKRQHWYHLFIDRSVLNRDRGSPPEEIFDCWSGQGIGKGEMGYGAGMIHAMNFLQHGEITQELIQALRTEDLQTIQPCFLRWYVALHDTAVCNVKNSQGRDHALGISLCNILGYSIRDYEMTPQVWHELEEEKLLFDACAATRMPMSCMNRGEFEQLYEALPSKKPDYEAYAGMYVRGDIHVTDTTLEEKKKRIQQACQVYLEDVAVSKKLEDAKVRRKAILRSIARLCRKLEINHVFKDGNQRTVVSGVLNWFLVQHGFCPAIVKDPTLFDGYLALDDLVEAIEEGQKHFWQLVQ